MRNLVIEIPLNYKCNKVCFRHILNTESCFETTRYYELDQEQLTLLHMRLVSLGYVSEPLFFIGVLLYYSPKDYR